jgi:glycerophosphoryl diester phosphodiesterase
LDNSLDAFAKAAAAGADGIEIDVRRSADGVLILSHDPSHPQIGQLHELSLADIRAVAPEIPTLSEAIEAIPSNVFINVEIKNHFGEPGFDWRRSIVDQTLDELSRITPLDRILLSSFDPFAVGRSRRRRPEVARGLLVTGRTSLRGALLWARLAHHNAVHLDRSHLFEDAADVVTRAAAHDLAVVVWTVDDPHEIEHLFRSGVAAIVTNDPAPARTIAENL